LQQYDRAISSNGAGFNLSGNKFVAAVSEFILSTKRKEMIMKAVMYEGVRSMKVSEQQRPAVAGPKDAVLRVTTTAICGSDLHMYEGRTALDAGHMVGHEIMGVIEEVGEAVTSIRKGDRVVLPFNIACG